jgi:hypothetical protein
VRPPRRALWLRSPIGKIARIIFTDRAGFLLEGIRLYGENAPLSSHLRKWHGARITEIPVNH